MLFELMWGVEIKLLEMNGSLIFGMNKKNQPAENGGKAR